MPAKIEPRAEVARSLVPPRGRRRGRVEDAGNRRAAFLGEQLLRALVAEIIDVEPAGPTPLFGAW
jgi:hypothetical protein